MLHGPKRLGESPGATSTKSEVLIILSSGKTVTRVWGYTETEDYSTRIYRPVESALALGDRIIDVLLELGAEINVGTFSSRWARSYLTVKKETIFDWVVGALNTLDNRIKDLKEELLDLPDKNNAEKPHISPAEITSWGEYLDDYYKRRAATSLRTFEAEINEKLQRLGSYERLNEYLHNIRSTLESMGAQTWSQVYGGPGIPKENPNPPASLTHINEANQQPKPKYSVMSNEYRRDWVPHELSERYDELFEAAFKGDDARIQSLCIPSCEESDTNTIPLQIAVECALPESKSSHIDSNPRLTLLV